MKIYKLFTNFKLTKLEVFQTNLTRYEHPETYKTLYDSLTQAQVVDISLRYVAFVYLRQETSGWQGFNHSVSSGKYTVKYLPINGHQL